MDMLLKGKRVLISGASSGIGREIALLFAIQKVHIVVTARREDRLTLLLDELEQLGAMSVIAIPADVTSDKNISKLAQQVAKEIDGIDILINAAGAARPTMLDASEEFWEEAMALNFHSARWLTTALLPNMRKRGWGRIINISGSMEPRALNASTAAKAAMHLWSKGLSCDLAAEGITVNCVVPGRINSEQIRNVLYPTEHARQQFIDHNIPIGYFGEPEDLGHLVVFLSSPLARYITGTVIPVDGGMHYFAH